MNRSRKNYKNNGTNIKNGDIDPARFLPKSAYRTPKLVSRLITKNSIEQKCRCSNTTNNLLD